MVQTFISLMTNPPQRSQHPQNAGVVEEIDWMAKNVWAHGGMEKLGAKIKAECVDLRTKGLVKVRA